VVFLCLAFCTHVADEALTGFLPVYNATVLAMRSEYAWFPMPPLNTATGWSAYCREYRLLAANAVCVSKCAVAAPLAYFFAGVHLLNGTGHTLATIFGQTVSSVTFHAPHRAFIPRRCSSRDPSISWFD